MFTQLRCCYVHIYTMGISEKCWLTFILVCNMTNVVQCLGRHLIMFAVIFLYAYLTISFDIKIHWVYKKHDILFSFVTMTNVGWFSQFLHTAALGIKFSINTLYFPPHLHICWNFIIFRPQQLQNQSAFWNRCCRFWHDTPRLHSVLCRHHPLQRVVLSQICCFWQRK